MVASVLILILSYHEFERTFPNILQISVTIFLLIIAYYDDQGGPFIIGPMTQKNFVMALLI